MNIKEQLHKELNVPEYPFLDTANNQLLGYTSECKHCFQCGYIRSLCTNPKSPTKFCLYGWYTAGLVSDQLCEFHELNPRWQSVSPDYFINRRRMVEQMIANEEVNNNNSIPEQALSIMGINEYMFKPVNIFVLGTDESTTMEGILDKWPWLKVGCGKPLFKISLKTDLDELRMSLVNQISTVSGVGHVPCMVLKWIDDLPEDYYNVCMQVIEDYETIQNVNINTRLIYSANIQTNEVRNLAWLNHSVWLEDLRGIAKGKPVICATAGPTLAESIESIKDNRDGYIVLAASTVVKKLVENDIYPDIIATVDMQNYNKCYLDAITPEQQERIYLAFDIDAGSEVVDAWHGPKIMMVSNIGETGTTKEILNHTPSYEFPKSGTVSTAVYNLAWLIGASEIYLAGYDLCYQTNSSHVDGVIGASNIQIHEQGDSAFIMFEETNTLDALTKIQTYEGYAWSTKQFHSYTIELNHRIRECAIPTYDLSPRSVAKELVTVRTLPPAPKLTPLRAELDKLPTKHFTNKAIKQIINGPINSTNWTDVKYNHIARITYLINQYTQYPVLQYGSVLQKLNDMVNVRAASLKQIVRDTLAKWKGLNNE